MFCRQLFFLMGAFAGLVAAAETDLSRYQTVVIEPARTSIYIGSITMTMPPFTRHGGNYASTYVAKVFPYFFYGEHGRISIEVSDEQLRQLGRGESIEFQGQGLSSEGEPRHIEGKVTPANTTSGKIKVRVFVSKRIQLIFNTVYRLEVKRDK